MNTLLRPSSWDICETDFPERGSDTEKLKFILQYAILAPSSRNTQPWLFRIDGHQVDFYADRARALPVADPDDREMIISCGAALLNLRIAMQHFGCFGKMDFFPNPDQPDMVAKVTLGSEWEIFPEQARLFEAIPKRRTNRQLLRNEKIPNDLLDTLAVAASEESCELRILQNDQTRQRVARLVAVADHIQWLNKRFRVELASWTRSSNEEVPDGIPHFAYGREDMLWSADSRDIQTFDMGRGQGAKDHEVVMYSPALAVLSTECDDPADWLMAGLGLQRVLLQARVAGLWASFLNQPIEITGLRTKLAEEAGGAPFPQILLRLGFGDGVKPTPRRNLEDFLI